MQRRESFKAWFFWQLGRAQPRKSERYGPKTTDKGPDMKETASCLWHLTMRRAFSVSRVSKVGSGNTLD
ncbi:hypothetical protein G5714_021766 [Onychostoma macrolepis]|uniref:Uncharacterized protein n=1 Tax=Onychostoma macrolepis TaxID=369639 RepID=A0A7J6BRZ5_9TELE|nr:hypothetical protein G5714_021766 [Onychostoma macrolepis]